MTKILPLWKDGRAYVIGGGPSLIDFDTTLLDGKRIIAVNNAYRLFPNADILYFMDAVWYGWHKIELVTFPGIIYTTASSLKDNKRAKYVGVGQRRGIDDREDFIARGTCSGFGAISIAIAMGVKEIILLGFDMGVNKDGRHNYHEDHKRAVPKDIYRDTHLKPFSSLIIPCRERGIKIINCTPGSKLDCFPKEELEKWL